jgi:hypothetical protein
MRTLWTIAPLTGFTTTLWLAAVAIAAVDLYLAQRWLRGRGVGRRGRSASAALDGEPGQVRAALHTIAQMVGLTVAAEDLAEHRRAGDRGQPADPPGGRGPARGSGSLGRRGREMPPEAGHKATHDQLVEHAVPLVAKAMLMADDTEELWVYFRRRVESECHRIEEDTIRDELDPLLERFPIDSVARVATAMVEERAAGEHH